MNNSVELIKDIAKGNRESLALLYDQYSAVVYGLALRVTESRDKTALVVQDVFQRIWQTASSFDSSKKDPFSWVIQIAKSVALENEGRSDQFDFFAFQESNSAGYSLHELFRQIDDKHRKVLELSFFRNLSEDQIENEMNIPVGTVATRLRLAIKAIRIVLN